MMREVKWKKRRTLTTVWSVPAWLMEEAASQLRTADKGLSYEGCAGV